MNEPLVTVGLPTYNNPEGLQKVLGNLANQTYKNLEIIVSVNPSVDEEVNLRYHEILDTYPNIKVHYQSTNIGGTPNYWFVLHEVPVHGKYFMYAQDDDEWSLGFVKYLVSLLEVFHDSPVAMSAVKRRDESGAVFDSFDLTGLNMLNAMRDDRLTFVFMGLWRTRRLREYSLPFIDSAIAARALMDGGVMIESNETYIKGMKHETAKSQVYKDPLIHMRVYYSLLQVTWQKSRLILPAVACVNLLWVVRNYAAQVLFLLPVDHPVRKFVRGIVR